MFQPLKEQCYYVLFNTTTFYSVTQNVVLVDLKNGGAPYITLPVILADNKEPSINIRSHCILSVNVLLDEILN